MGKHIPPLIPSPTQPTLNTCTQCRLAKLAHILPTPLPILLSKWTNNPTPSHTHPHITLLLLRRPCNLPQLLLPTCHDKQSLNHSAQSLTPPQHTTLLYPKYLMFRSRHLNLRPRNPLVLVPPPRQARQLKPTQPTLHPPLPCNVGVCNIYFIDVDISNPPPPQFSKIET